MTFRDIDTIEALIYDATNSEFEVVTARSRAQVRMISVRYFRI